MSEARYRRCAWCRHLIREDASSCPRCDDGRGRVSDTTNPYERTQEFVDTRNCPWCTAKAGEFCYAQVRGRPGAVERALTATHHARMWNEEAYREALAESPSGSETE